MILRRRIAVLRPQPSFIAISIVIWPNHKNHLTTSSTSSDFNLSAYALHPVKKSTGRGKLTLSRSFRSRITSPMSIRRHEIVHVGVGVVTKIQQSLFSDLPSVLRKMILRAILSSVIRYSLSVSSTMRLSLRPRNIDRANASFYRQFRRN